MFFNNPINTIQNTIFSNGISSASADMAKANSEQSPVAVTKKSLSSVMKKSVLILSSCILAGGFIACDESTEQQDDQVMVTIHEDAPSSDKMSLIASFDYEDGQAVEFYELPTGEVAVSVEAPVDTVPVVTPAMVKNMPADDLFLSIAPADVELPERLLDAAQKSYWDKGGESEIALDTEGSSAFMNPTWNGGDSWFYNKFCSSMGYYDFQYCALLRTQPNSMRHNNAFYFFTTLHTRTGITNMQVQRLNWWTGWTTLGAWDVPAGYYRWFSTGTNSMDHPDFRSNIGNVYAGDSFNHAAYGLN